MREDELCFAEFAIELQQCRNDIADRNRRKFGFWEPDRPFIPNDRLAYLLRNHILCQVKKIFF